MGVTEAAERVERLLGPLRRAWDSSPAIVAVTLGPDHRLAYQNAASERMFGCRERDVPLPTAFPELAGRALTVLDSVLATGEVVEVPRRAVGMRDLAGGEVLLHYVVAPLGIAAPYDGLVITSIDVAAEARAEQAAGRAELLSRISERMTLAADSDEGLQALTDELVPAIADLAAVYVLHLEQPGPAPTGPAAMTVDPALLAVHGPPPRSEPSAEPSPWAAALAAGRPLLIPVSDEASRADLADPTGAAWLAAVDGRTIAVLPLVVAGQLAGALVLLAAGERAPYRSDDLPLLEDVAARAGSAVAHLRSFQRQRQVALNLQRALLPSQPPPLPGLEVAARYLAGGEDVEIGGDWWDVHHLGAGRVAVGVGDVSGRGIPAAVVMGQARAAMRAAAHADLSPADVLTLLDAHVEDLVKVDDSAQHLLPPRFATAAYAVIEPFDEALRVASAGHPPLLVRRPSGRVDVVVAPAGPPLGIGVGGYDELLVPFPAGSLLVAFTDGLVESRTTELEDGVRQLADQVAAVPASMGLDELADQLIELADGQDDTALVLVRLTESAAPRGRYSGTLRTTADVPAARRAVTALAAEHVPSVAEATGQVAAELLANAIEHAGPPVQVRAHATRDRVVVEVADTSALAPRPRVASADDERGRGLPLVAAFTSQWGSRVTRAGKATWAELRSTDG